MSVKTHFNIKDLENLSGVKAHTIRIWEKRYGLFTPNRTDTNIRQYDLKSFKKLLDITFIYNHGIKISKIAEFSPQKIKDVILDNAILHKEYYAVNELKNAMFDFDTEPIWEQLCYCFDEMKYLLPMSIRQCCSVCVYYCFHVVESRSALECT